MDNCFQCNNSECCPQHCCDWDRCLCKDCENCGGPSRSSKEKKLDLKIEVRGDGNKTGNSSQPDVDENFRIKAQENAEREETQRRNNEIEEHRRIERLKREEIMKTTQDCLERNRQILESSLATLEKSKNARKTVQNIEKKYQEFKDGYENVMKRVLNKAFGPVDDIDELKSKFGSPKLSNINEVVQVLLKASRISIITGAGVSAESGVFTYKGNEEKFDIAGKQMSLQEVMQAHILEWHPLDFWKNIQFNRKRFSESRPNPVHRALFNLMTRYRRKGRRVSLITQNIDGFDRVELNNDPDFFEVHGNTNEMRCKAVCCKNVFPCPEFREELIDVPSCTACGGIMRPNVLLYGESYTEEFYRAESAKRACNEAEVLVVVGTQIKCGFALAEVKAFAERSKPIIEINVEPVIEYGQVYVLDKKCGQVFPSLTEKLFKLLN